MEFNGLISMKKSSKKPKEGDIFVVQPLDNVFYFGKVIQVDLESRDSFVAGMILIYIYACSARDKVIPSDLDDWDFLIAPIIVNYQPWRKGYFETVGNSAVTEKEKKANYAFWDILRKTYVDSSGKEVKKRPKYSSIFGLGSYGIVEKEIQKALEKAVIK